MTTFERYHRQALLKQIGPAGQEKLARASVLLVGCGALGCNIAQQLARAGVGRIRIVDRDLVDLTNLHRQVLFTEADAQRQTPKAIAAAEALAAVNSRIAIEGIVADVDSGNITKLALDGGRPDLILDGTDNAQVRYLINDLACQQTIPWVYGACVGVEGRVMAIWPHQSACLRCLYPEPPGPGELETCDTAGVLGPAAAVVGAMQAAQAMRLLIEGPAAAGKLLALDAWTIAFRTIASGKPHEQCVCCGAGEYPFLNRPPRLDAATLCGRDAVQVRPTGNGEMDLVALAQRLAPLGQVAAHPQFARFRPEGSQLTLSIFADGRVIVNGTADVSAARVLVARYVGA